MQCQLGICFAYFTNRPFPFASFSKRVFVRDHSYGNVFPSPVHLHANQTYFYMKGFARGLVLKQRHKVTRKWPIT